MNVRFVAGVGAIVQDASSGRDFYAKQLGLPVKSETNSDYSTVDLPGLKHFGLWTIRDAARSVFESDEWPAGVPIPQANVELEVDDVASAVEELRSRGLRMLRDVKLEPWGQTTARLLSPEGLLIGIVHTPDLRAEPPDG